MHLYNRSNRWEHGSENINLILARSRSTICLSFLLRFNTRSDWFCWMPVPTISKEALLSSCSQHLTASATGLHNFPVFFTKRRFVPRRSSRDAADQADQKLFSFRALNPQCPRLVWSDQPVERDFTRYPYKSLRIDGYRVGQWNDATSIQRSLEEQREICSVAG